MSVRSWWRALRSAMRSSSLLGRAFRLRDQGRLPEALDVCRQALNAARLAGAPSDLGFSTTVVGALTIDEIVRKLGQPELAREPLEEALRALERVNGTNPDRPSESLQDMERQVRARLDVLRSAG